MRVTVMVRTPAYLTPTMVTGTILWSGGQRAAREAFAPLQSGPDPLLELLLLELLLLLLELLLLELPLELLLPDSVSATTNRESSEATAVSAPAPRSAYMSFDIILSSRFCRPQADARLNLKRRPFPAIGSIWVKRSHWQPNQNVTQVAFASALQT